MVLVRMHWIDPSDRPEEFAANDFVTFGARFECN